LTRKGNALERIITARPREFVTTIQTLIRESGLDLVEVELSLLRLEASGYIDITARCGDLVKGRCNIGPELPDLLGTIEELDVLTKTIC
jgi:hypothetical protein